LRKIFVNMTIKHQIAKRKSASECGFTLVELMVTVAIIALVAGLTFAELNSDSYRLKATAKTLKANMQKARLLAVKDSCPAYVDFDFDGVTGIDSGYTLWKDLNKNGSYDDATTDNNGDGATNSLDEEKIETITLPNDISFGTVASGSGGPTTAGTVTYGSDQLRFSPRGTSSSGSAHLHCPNNDSAGTYKLKTNNIGRVNSQYWATGGGTWR
jgi:prepilin-type N-terminal cleavage/methylation domain-containing protein